MSGVVDAQSSNTAESLRNAAAAAETERNCYGNALSLLKHCDVDTLQKLCGALSNDDSQVVYANFPKRSLVKCFSARDKYDWHVAQTAELENLSKKWEALEQQRQQRGQSRRNAQATYTRRRAGMASGAFDSTEDCNKGSKASSKSNLSSRHQPPRKTSLSPLVVNEAVLQEAFTVAEHFHPSEDSDLPSPLSSCLKTQSDTSEPDFDFNRRPKPAQNQTLNNHSVLTPREPSSSRVINGLTQEVKHGSCPTLTREHSKKKGGSSKTEMTKRGKASFSVPPVKALANTATTPRTSKHGSAVQPKVEKRSNGGPASAFRGALSTCLGSRNASVDCSLTPRVKTKTCSRTRELSQGPSSRSFLRGSFKKASSFGGRTNLSGYSSGSIGNFKSSSLSGSRVWK